MINSIDLRINNILQYSEGYFKVKSISNRIIGADRNKGVVEFKPSELNPIPLTEEILLKVGFVNEFSNSWSDNVFQLFENKGNVAGAEIGEFYCSTGQRYVTSFKYLHQLQNLYFALTGEELNTAGLI